MPFDSQRIENSVQSKLISKTLEHCLYQAAARELNMHDVSEFYSSAMFTKSFAFNEDGTKIVKVFPQSSILCLMCICNQVFE